MTDAERRQKLYEIEKCQYDEYMRTHQGTPGCGGALMIMALAMFVFAFVL